MVDIGPLIGMLGGLAAVASALAAAIVIGMRREHRSDLVNERGPVSAEEARTRLLGALSETLLSQSFLDQVLVSRPGFGKAPIIEKKRRRTKRSAHEEEKDLRELKDLMSEVILCYYCLPRHRLKFSRAVIRAAWQAMGRLPSLKLERNLEPPTSP